MQPRSREGAKTDAKKRRRGQGSEKKFFLATDGAPMSTDEEEGFAAKNAKNEGSIDPQISRIV